MVYIVARLRYYCYCILKLCCGFGGYIMCCLQSGFVMENKSLYWHLETFAIRHQLQSYLLTY